MSAGSSNASSLFGWSKTNYKELYWFLYLLLNNYQWKLIMSTLKFSSICFFFWCIFVFDIIQLSVRIIDHNRACGVNQLVQWFIVGSLSREIQTVMGDYRMRASLPSVQRDWKQHYEAQMTRWSFSWSQNRFIWFNGNKWNQGYMMIIGQEDCNTVSNIFSIPFHTQIIQTYLSPAFSTLFFCSSYYAFSYEVFLRDTFLFLGHNWEALLSSSFFCFSHHSLCSFSSSYQLPKSILTASEKNIENLAPII